MHFELAPFSLPADYAEGVLSLAEAKAHLGIDADDDYFDDLVGAFRDAAIDMVERYCGVRLAPVTGLVWQAESLPDRLVLGVRPVTAITALAWLDSSGDAQTGDAATLRIGAGGVVLPRPGQVWPSGMAGGISLTYSAGYTDAQRPAALVQAARMFTAHLFANREAVQATGTVGGEVPLGFRMLCNAYRMPVI